MASASPPATPARPGRRLLCREARLIIDGDGGGARHTIPLTTTKPAPAGRPRRGHRIIRFWDDGLGNADGVLHVIRDCAE